MDLILQAATLTFLRAALESSMMQKRIVAEGRTKMTPEEEDALRKLTDVQAQLAHDLSERLE